MWPCVHFSKWHRKKDKCQLNGAPVTFGLGMCSHSRRPRGPKLKGKHFRPGLQGIQKAKRSASDNWKRPRSQGCFSLSDFKGKSPADERHRNPSVAGSGQVSFELTRAAHIWIRQLKTRYPINVETKMRIKHQVQSRALSLRGAIKTKAARAHTWA